MYTTYVFDLEYWQIVTFVIFVFTLVVIFGPSVKCELCLKRVKWWRFHWFNWWKFHGVKLMYRPLCWHNQLFKRYGR